RKIRRWMRLRVRVQDGESRASTYDGEWSAGSSRLFVRHFVIRSGFANLALQAAATIAMAGGTVVCSQERSAPKEKQVIDPQLLAWVREAPFSDPAKTRAHPNFSYEDWFARGRKLPHAVDNLVELLEQEDLHNPSGDGMR